MTQIGAANRSQDPAPSTSAAEGREWTASAAPSHRWTEPGLDATNFLTQERGTPSFAGQTRFLIAPPLDSKQQPSGATHRISRGPRRPCDDLC